MAGHLKTNQKFQNIETFCLIILAAVATAVSLYWLKPLMVPFVLALFFTLAIDPLVQVFKHKLKLPRFLSIIFTLLLGCLLLIFLWGVFTASIAQLVKNANTYQDKISILLSQAAGWIDFEKYGIDPKSVVTPLIKNITVGVGGFILGTVNSVVALLSKGILVIIFVIFLLMGDEVKTKSKKRSTWQEAQEKIKKYIGTKVIFSTCTGVLVGLTLSILGIDLALVFGLAAFVLNFIPSIGSIIATLLPLPVIILTPGISLTTASLAFIIPGLIQFSIGNVIEPKIMGSSLKLHPVTILMALIFWGMIWGIVGMMFAVPLTSILKILFTNMEITKPIANLLEGQMQ